MSYKPRVGTKRGAMPPTVDSASIQEIALVGRLINIAIDDKTNTDIQEATSTQLHLTQAERVVHWPS